MSGNIDLNIFKQRLFPKVVRNITQFAEEEVILPKGPRKGMTFSVDFMPLFQFVFDAIESSYWSKIAIVGPTQSGKSLIGINIPMLYYLFEQEEDIIVGIPHMDLAKGIYQEKILPVILSTKYRDLLPDKGAGARGGTPTAIQFKNGVWLRFMGAGGGDAQRSSHTARIIIMTEVDKMDDAGEASEEADPVSQIEMRSDAFENSKTIIECTVTSEHGRIWQEAMILGSQGKVHVPCHKCNQYQTLDHHQLIYDPTNVVSAQETAKYKCIHCGDLWSNIDRLEALNHPILVHKGQNIKDGQVIGDLPKTRTFGLHYNVLYSPMQSLGKTAAQKWEAEKSDLKEKKKALQQSKWALPWKDSDTHELSVSYLQGKARSSNVKRGTVPYWADFLVMSCDVQDYGLYWEVDAYNSENVSQIIDYGVVDNSNKSDDALRTGLNRIYDLSLQGWTKIGEDGSQEIIYPRLHGIDVGYRTHILLPWLKGKRQWIAIKGIGTFQRNRMTGKKAALTIPGILQVRQQDSGQFIWFVEVDETKSIVHDRFMLEEGVSGHTIIPTDMSRGWFYHMCSERRVLSQDSKGYKWEKVPGRRANHWLDCRSYNVALSTYIILKNARQEIQMENKQRKAEAGRRTRLEESNEVNYFNAKGRFFS